MTTLLFAKLRWIPDALRFLQSLQRAIADPADQESIGRALAARRLSSRALAIRFRPVQDAMAD
jgi:hypothetical protein